MKTETLLAVRRFAVLAAVTLAVVCAFLALFVAVTR